MSQAQDAIVFDLNQPFDGNTFKQVLTDAGYSQTSLAQTLGITSSHERQDREVVMRRAQGDSPYEILVRLFWLGRPVDEPRVRKHLSSLDVDMHIARLLAACDGRHSLRELITNVAENLNSDPDTVIPGCLNVIRKLMQSGFLSVADTEDESLS